MPLRLPLLGTMLLAVVLLAGSGLPNVWRRPIGFGRRPALPRR
jgi:hypothetical protein